MVNKVRVAFRLGQALVHTFTLLMARPPRMWGMRASSLWISASVGALLWAAGCPAARSDACPSRGQGRGSCGCDMWNSVMCSSSGGLQKTSVPVAGRLHTSTPQVGTAVLCSIAEANKAKEH